MPSTVTVPFLDGHRETYYGYPAVFDAVDLQIYGDSHHWPILRIHRSRFTEVDCDGFVWRWDGHRPERVTRDPS